jgi:F0F1-type ATP synthase assembly protein I
VVPGAWFALRMLSRGPGSRPEDMLGTFYAAAAVRLVLAAALLFILVPVFTDALVPLLTTLAAALAVQWFALLWKG